MKKFLKKIITFFFVKTKLILLLEKKILKYRSFFYQNKSIIPLLNKRSILDHIIVTNLYFNEYYRNLKDQKKQKKISLMTLSNGEGSFWARHYYTSEKGTIHRKNRSIIYSETEKLIKDNNLNNSKVFFINLGSSSGLDLLYFKEKFDNINYISSDINEEIIDFQKNNTFKNISEIDYVIGSVEEVVEKIKIKFQKNPEIKLIFFANATIQYVVPQFLEKKFENLRDVENKFYFCSSEQFRKNTQKEISFHIKNILWHHDLKEYVEKYKFKIKFYKKQDSGKDRFNQNQNLIFSN
tara:strand:- start:6412 stop:7296 length:885 start_codon:yes stop_codon:yes gene_type:complete